MTHTDILVAFSRDLDGVLNAKQEWRINLARFPGAEDVAVIVPDLVSMLNIAHNGLREGLQVRIEATLSSVKSNNSILTAIAPINQEYMKLPIMDGFNWADCFTNAPDVDWYLVVFRCQHKYGIDTELLNQLDAAALAGIREMPGFIHYFAGTPDENGYCLSFCVWEGQKEAQLSADHEAHKKAQVIVDDDYYWFRLERYSLRNSSGVIIIEAL